MTNLLIDTSINLKDFTDAPVGEPLVYVVYEEHTLGYIMKVTSDHFQLAILHTSVLKGSSLNPYSSVVTISDFNIDSFRKATEADFTEYRVSSHGCIK